MSGSEQHIAWFCVVLRERWVRLPLRTADFDLSRCKRKAQL